MTEMKRGSSKLDRRDYWMTHVDVPPWNAPESDIRKHLYRPGEISWGVRAVTIFADSLDVQDADYILRAMRIYADEGVHYWFLLSFSGSMAYAMTPQLLEILLADEKVRNNFLGLFISEPTWLPSLTHGFEYDHARPWFNKTHYCIPNHLGHQLGHGGGFVSGYATELSADQGAIIEPLPKPIENPVEALEAFRVSFGRWVKPFIDLLGEGEALTSHSWAGSKKHFMGGYDNIKLAQATYPFDRWSTLLEINNFDHSVSFAESRGLARAWGGPWGLMVGGVRWKYHELWRRPEGLPHFPDASSMSYSSSMDMPGWVLFVPAAAGWAEGARMFQHESGEDQLLNNPSVANAVRSLRLLLDNAGPPMDPETHTCLLKGDAYFAGEVPGYENGMAEEAYSEVDYQCGRNTGGYRLTPASLVATFFPRTRSTRQWEDAFLSGNPNGGFDILHAAVDLKLLQRYDRVVMIDWNRLADDQHRGLLGYVKAGGQLVIAAGQLFTQAEGQIKWQDPPCEAFYQGGDLRELCGVKFAGGSQQCNVLLNGDCLVQDPMLENDGPSQVTIYAAEEVLDSAEVLLKTPEGRPVVVRQAVGNGSVITVLGPSYLAAMGDFAQGFFNWIARENRRSLSYRIDQVTGEEEKDLIVSRDLGRQRVALCNYWRRYDMTPRLTLQDEPGDEATVERIDVYDVHGQAASWRSTAQVRRQLCTWVSLPSHSMGIVRYEEPGEQDRNTLAFTWRAIKTQNFYASLDQVSSTTRRVGPVEVLTTRDSMAETGTQPTEASVRSWIDMRVLDCPAGQWRVEIEVCDEKGKMIRTNTLDATVKDGSDLSLGRDVVGYMFGGWTMKLLARQSG